MRRLERPRDLAITDFRLTMRPHGVLTDRSGRSYLVYASSVRPPEFPAPVLHQDVAEPARRFTEWALYAFCSAAAVAAIWFGFLAPEYGAPCCLDSQASHFSLAAYREADGSFAPVSLRNFGRRPL
jgi:hypothetical protein